MGISPRPEGWGLCFGGLTGGLGVDTPYRFGTL